jgi:hypothetical protein
MSDETRAQDLLSLWQRSMEQSVEAWRKLLGQPQAPEMFQFWRPMFGQGLDAWIQAFQQGANTLDVLTQWKKFMDDSLEAWSKVLGEAMATEGFASALGKFLEQYLNTVGPMRKSLQSGSEELLRTMNLPSRKQVTDLASHLVSMEARLEAIEDRIEELIGSFASLGALVKQARPPRTSPAGSPKQGRVSQRPSQKEA